MIRAMPDRPDVTQTGRQHCVGDCGHVTRLSQLQRHIMQPLERVDCVDAISMC